MFWRPPAPRLNHWIFLANSYRSLRREFRNSANSIRIMTQLLQNKSLFSAGVIEIHLFQGFPCDGLCALENLEAKLSARTRLSVASHPKVQANILKALFSTHPSTLAFFGWCHVQEHCVQPVRSRASMLFQHRVPACQSDRQCEMESDDTGTRGGCLLAMTLKHGTPHSAPVKCFKKNAFPTPSQLAGRVTHPHAARSPTCLFLWTAVASVHVTSLSSPSASMWSKTRNRSCEQRHHASYYGAGTS